MKNMSKCSPKIDVLKASRSQLHSSYYGLSKSRVAPRTVLPGFTSTCGELFLRKRLSKRRLVWKPRKLKMASPTTSGGKTRTGCLKTLPGGEYKNKTWMNNDILIAKVLQTKNMPKPFDLQWNQCFCKFLNILKNQYTKGCQKLTCWRLLWTWGRQGSIVCVLCL